MAQEILKLGLQNLINAMLRQYKTRAMVKILKVFYGEGNRS